MWLLSSHDLPQIDWAATVIKLLSKDEHFADIDTEDTPTLDPLPSVLQGEEDNQDPFTILLMFYAKKSLEFPLLSYQMSSTDIPGTIFVPGLW